LGDAVIQIVDLDPTNDQMIQEVAALLVEGFKEHWPDAWPDVESALDEIRESFGAGRISRVALDEQGAAVGWIGGIEQYDGHVWELHPLVVKNSLQGRGIGRALVEDLEQRVAERGGLTLSLGTDDEDNQTSLSGEDLYPNIWDHVGRIRNLRGHPYEFYQKLGFVIVGVMPDANGPGKPDILMAKRVQGAAEWKK
jgi:aminoglycoside 6'-N-acetyltransferase I